MSVTRWENAEIVAACRKLREEATRIDSIDPEACADAVETAYGFLGLESPQVVFCESPLQAMQWLQARAPIPGDESIVQTEWERVAHAQSQMWPALGSEQALAFHNELEFGVFNAYAWDFIWWPEIRKRVEQKTYEVLCLAHAVEKTLEALVTRKRDVWLLYTRAMASPWKAAEHHAGLRVLQGLGKIESLPPHYSVGASLLQQCSWLYAFERVCVICNRPSAIERLNAESSTRRTTLIRWRDGWECRYVPQ